MIYIISDTHFSHANIIKYCDRPYENTQIMNEDIIQKWNNVVKQDDLVIHLGDVGFGLVEHLKPLIHSLNGHKVLIKGNHDMNRGNDSWKNLGFDIIYKNREVNLNTILTDVKDIYQSDIEYKANGFIDIILSHYPRQCEETTLNIHGHIHNVPVDISLYQPENHFCASVEMINYIPIDLNEILIKMGK